VTDIKITTVFFDNAQSTWENVLLL